MDFLLFLRMGNDALQTPDQLADLLVKVSNNLDDGVIPFGVGTANLTDANGNTVGFYNFKESDDGK